MKDKFLHSIELLKNKPESFRKKLNYYFYGAGDTMISYWFILFLLISNKNNYPFMIAILVMFYAVFIWLKRVLLKHGVLENERETRNHRMPTKIMLFCLTIFVAGFVMIKICSFY